LPVKDLSIGMFDSGLGGLTVLREVRQALPCERMIYLGDTARVPYGNRSPRTVTRYSIENTRFLLSKGIKMLVIACNTSSAIALSALKRTLPIPVIGVIDPPSREAVRRTRSKKIGVIGTRATINSLAYVKAIRRLDPSIEVFSVACPLFVPIVEEGLEDDEIARMVVNKYLSGLKGSGIDVLVMGCTHYPILERRIRALLGTGVYIVNSGRETALDVQRLLRKHDAAKDTGKGGCSFYVTDAPDKLADLGSRVLGEPLKQAKLVKISEPAPSASFL